MNSTSAPRVKMPTAQADPMKARAEPERLIQPRCAAQATTAGAVMDRNPATTPIPKASNNTSPEFMKPLQRDGRLARDLAFNLKSTPHVRPILSSLHGAMEEHNADRAGRTESVVHGVSTLG